MRSIRFAFVALAALVISQVSAGVAPAATPTPPPTVAPIPVVTGVSATWATMEGFLVGWTPASGSGATAVTGYLVTASNGNTCSVSGLAAKECVFSNSKVPFGFKPYQRYTFTVQAVTAKGLGQASQPSNAAGWFGAPNYPDFVAGKTISNSQIDVAWIPDAATGGTPLSGYKIYYWPLNQDSQQKLVTSATNSVSITGLAKSTWYVIAVQSCNYYGCSTADWAYQATTPAAASTSSSLLPRTISGGSASTTCWNAILDGMSPSSSKATLTKSPTACPVPVAPSTWPQVDPAAVNSPNLPIATKFNPQSSFSLSNAAYSMSYRWNDLDIKTTNFTRTRSLAPRNYESVTPTVCSIINKNGGQQAHFLAAGTCTIRMTIQGDQTFEATPAQTASFVIKP
jgi:Fibronectin type III domain